MARDLQRLIDGLTRVPLEAKLAVGETIHATQWEAVALSSGTVSSADLARMDHPFAKRHGSPQTNLLPINAQSGEFRNSWVTHGPSERGGTVVASLENVSPHADFLEGGTRFMFARPLELPLTDFAERVLEVELGRAFRSAFR